MKLNCLPELLFDQLHELHAMESQVARSLPVLSGSVMNVRLRKLLTERALRARDRRDWLADQMMRHERQPETRMHLAIGGILGAGNKHLAETGDPFMRDLLMIRHCIRIEQHAARAYGFASRLAESAGLTAESGRLASFLSELIEAGVRFRSIESELSPAALFPRARAGHMKTGADHPGRNRPLKPNQTQKTR